MPQDDLEPLITECPSCQTRFRVAEGQLQRARGRVRCGACLTVFDGVERLVLDADATAVDEAGAREALDELLDELAGTTSASADDAEPPDPPAPAAGEQANEPQPAASSAAVPQPPAHAGALPDFTPEATAPADEKRLSAAPPPSEERAATVAGPTQASEPPPAAAVPPADAVPAKPEQPAPGGEPVTEPVIFFGERRDRRPWVWGGIAAGLLLLAAQILWYRYDAWAVRPEWRGVYSLACGVLGCELPAQRDPARLSTRNLVVRSHPEQPGTLAVDAVIVNEADFAQPFPVLELQFTTLRGNLVASRRYHPDEYLAGDAAGLTLIPPRTPVQIALSLDDPGPHAVNYRLSFR